MCPRRSGLGVLSMNAGICCCNSGYTSQLLQTIPEPLGSPQVWGRLSSLHGPGSGFLPLPTGDSQGHARVLPEGTQGGVHSQFWGWVSGSGMFPCPHLTARVALLGAGEGLGDRLAAGPSTLKPPNSLSSVFAHTKLLSPPALGGSPASTAPLRFTCPGPPEVGIRGWAVFLWATRVQSWSSHGPRVCTLGPSLGWGASLPPTLSPQPRQPPRGPSQAGGAPWRVLARGAGWLQACRARSGPPFPLPPLPRGAVCIPSHGCS